jgi:hypothetical protein
LYHQSKNYYHMETQNLIFKIINAQNPTDIFNKTHFKKEYLGFMKMLHPDVCALENALDAVQKLNDFKEQMENALKIEDDAGHFRVENDTTLLFETEDDTAFFKTSLMNYNWLMKHDNAAAQHFKKMLPTKITLSNNQLRVHSNERLVPLSGLVLPTEHVNWILSRLFEFVGWLDQIGYVHAGLNPESIAILPKTHGIVITSFYHLVKKNTRLNTLSARYLNWYPPSVFDIKMATSYIDLTLAQRTALYLLGDKSANGVILKKTINEELIDFLIQPHIETYETYDSYRKLLGKLYGKPKYYELII